MEILNKEIIVANRFIYYYANFVERIYGFVLRKDGENLPEEHYVGRLRPLDRKRRWSGRSARRTSIRSKIHRQGDPQNPRPAQKGRWGTDPDPGEIVLFLYRRRLMLGYFLPRVRGRKIAVIAEDQRRLSLRKNALIYLTGITTSDDPDILQAYAASIRALAAHIDLEEIWEPFKEDPEPLSISDIATLYWEDEIDASRWIALYLHLRGACPYFEDRGANTWVPLKPEDAQTRKTLFNRREAQSQELAEFLYWFSQSEADPYAPETLTQRQQHWLEQIQQYALWGTEARESKQAKKFLSAISPGSGDLQRRAFDLLMNKGVWQSDENLDLIRAEIPLDFSKEAIRMADAIDPDEILKSGRRRKLWRHRPFSLHNRRSPELAFSLKRRWLGGYELGVHIPDVASLVPAGSALDRAASDRMATLHLPDRELPLLPPRLSENLCRFQVGEQRPALSLLWKLDRNWVVKSLNVVPSVITNRECLSYTDAEAVCEGQDHPLGKTLQLLDRLAQQLGARRKQAGALPASNLPDLRIEIEGEEISIREEDPTNKAHRIVQELSIFASVEMGKWCASKTLPVIYETRDPLEHRDALEQIPHPVVRRHEIRRQTPPVSFSAEPGVHHSLGVSACCPILSPAQRYPDLMVQRQVRHYLINGEALYQPEEIDLIRYRAQEELDQLDRLRYRRERYMVLKHLSTSTDQIFSAVVLHLRRDGALVELTDLPLKTVVRPHGSVSVGDVIQVRLAGVDLWRSQAHMAVR